MLVQTAFDFKWPDPLARHLHQIIGAALKIEIAVPLDKAITRVDPSAPHGFRRLVRAPPVTGGRGITTNKHDTLLARRRLIAIWAFKPDIVPRHRRASSANPVVVGRVGKVDVEHFGRAKPFGWAMASNCFPGVVDIPT